MEVQPEAAHGLPRGGIAGNTRTSEKISRDFFQFENAHFFILEGKLFFEGYISTLNFTD